ncbi:TIGR00266 family protein [Hydrocarboniphaga sp.]|uniref:TIGR00266 family protein n=1 Tax=Hydrocarboniphaga sp. TaxID=2033016 RepID=UPI003D0B9C11
MAMDIIDYKIYGTETQFVEVELDPGEAAVGEAGAMMFMEDGIVMDTVFGDGSAQQKNFWGKLVGAGKRLVTGESLFTTVFQNNGNGKRKVAFAAPYPGTLIPIHLPDVGGTLICQKDSFLCAAKGVALGIEFQRKLGVGLFGGEGFVMQRLDGDGLAFIHAGGTLYERDLQPGEVLKVDTGCIVALTRSVSYDIQYVGGLKSALFSGEGVFFAVLQGPGKIWLQSLPLSRMANRIVMAAPAIGGRSSETGSLLGAGAAGGLLGGLLGDDE